MVVHRCARVLQLSRSLGRSFGSGEDFWELVTSLPYYYAAVGFESRGWWKQRLGTTKLYKIPKAGGEISQWAGHRLWFPLPMWKAPWRRLLTGFSHHPGMKARYVPSPVEASYMPAAWPSGQALLSQSAMNRATRKNRGCLVELEFHINNKNILT